MVHYHLKYFLAMIMILLSTSILKAQSNNIQVISDPDVSVFLDGLYKGKTTAEMGGFIVENVSSDSHTIKIVKVGFDPQEEQINVKPGEVYVHKMKPFVPKTMTRTTADNSIKSELKPISEVSVDKDGTDGTLTDPVTSEVYKTIVIGIQTWIAENLRTTNFIDGIAIPNITDGTAWYSLLTPGYCWYNNDVTNKADYGALYNWFAVNTGKLCPAGWHVPNDSEWITLIDGLRRVTDKKRYKDIAAFVGDKLKETGKTHWKQYLYVKSTATNETGFTALPGGIRMYGGFASIGEEGNWWSSTEGSLNNAYDAWALKMNQNHSIVRWNSGKSNGISVRCLKD